MDTDNKQCYLKVQHICNEEKTNTRLLFLSVNTHFGRAFTQNGRLRIRRSIKYLINLILPMMKRPFLARVNATLIWCSSVINPRLCLHQPRVGCGSILYSGNDRTKLKMT